MTRLYTEDVNRDNILAVLDKYEDAYTIFAAIGAYHGVRENSLVIELARNISLAEAETIAEEIATVNKQESVLVTRGDNFSEFVTPAEA